MGNSITSNKNLVIQTYNTADGTLPTTAVTTSGLTSGTPYTTWDVPENYNEAALDLILGGTASVSVTGASGTVALTADKYQPLALRFTGTLTANVTYTVPSGVGGTWVVRNETTGSFTITLQSLTSGASATFVVPQDNLPYSVTCIAVSGGGFYTSALADGSISTAKIVDLAVTTAKLADGAVTTVKMADYSITNAKLLPSVINGLTAKTTLASNDEFAIYDSDAALTISGFVFSGAGPTYTATATTSVAHGYTTGNSVTVSGATGNTSVNGTFTITVTSSTQFTYTVTSSASVTGSPVVVQNPGLKKITWDNVQSQAQIALSDTFSPLSGYLFGLTTSNNALDAVNDIDVAAGVAADSTNSVTMKLTSALTKQLDATWSVGTNAGGRDPSNALANGWWHIFLIMRSDTGVVDVLFSTSPTSPTLPTNYNYKRRIGSFYRVGGAIKAYFQYGNQFNWDVPVSDVSTSSPGTSAVTATMTVPTGIVVNAILSAGMNTGSLVPSPFLLITSLSQTNTIPSSTAFSVAGPSNSTGSMSGSAIVNVFTNTSAQIRYRMSTNIALFINTNGWIDDRGQSA